MHFKKALFIAISLLFLNSGLAADISKLISELKSRNEHTRYLAGKALFEIANPVIVAIDDKYVDKKTFNEILDKSDPTVRKAVEALVNGNPQDNKYIFIFQAYYFPGVKSSPESLADAFELAKKTSGWYPIDFDTWQRHLEDNKRYSRYSFPPKNYTGVWYTWYRNGNEQTKRSYKNGKAHGKWIEWYESGEIKGEANYKDNKLNGKCTEYHKNGKKAREFYMKDGKLCGPDRFWDKNGNLLKKNQQ